MTIQLNGEPCEIADSNGCSVLELLERLGLAGRPALVELDGQALLKSEFAERRVIDGSRVEIVRMVAGG